MSEKLNQKPFKDRHLLTVDEVPFTDRAIVVPNGKAIKLLRINNRQIGRYFFEVNCFEDYNDPTLRSFLKINIEFQPGWNQYRVKNFLQKPHLSEREEESKAQLSRVLEADYEHLHGNAPSPVKLKHLLDGFYDMVMNKNGGTYDIPPNLLGEIQDTISDIINGHQQHSITNTTKGGRLFKTYYKIPSFGGFHVVAMKKVPRGKWKNFFSEAQLDALLR